MDAAVVLAVLRALGLGVGGEEVAEGGVPGDADECNEIKMLFRRAVDFGSVRSGCWQQLAALTVSCFEVADVAVVKT